jgi:5-methylcytosine-specific restriction endonuclease McrA
VILSKCKVCGKHIKSFPTKMKMHCSRKCRNETMKSTMTLKHCLICGVEIEVRLWEKERRYCSRKCVDAGQTGERHPNWKGGDRKKTALEWARRNPQNISKNSAIRRARLWKIEGSHTEEEWELKKKISEYKCVYCGKIKKLTKDHIVPISKGGDDFITNIQPLCSKCNTTKGNRKEKLLMISGFVLNENGQILFKEVI